MPLTGFCIGDFSTSSTVSHHLCTGAWELFAHPVYIITYMYIDVHVHMLYSILYTILHYTIIYYTILLYTILYNILYYHNLNIFYDTDNNREPQKLKFPSTKASQLTDTLSLPAIFCISL